MKTIILTILFIMIGFTPINSKNYYKWGKITDYEKKLTLCKYDTSANAVVIFKRCNVFIKQSHVVYKIDKRVKILKKNGLGNGNISINYYHKDGMENIRHIKAHTINIDETGKAIKQKVKPSSIFRSKINDRWSELTFAFPDVKVGSYIEFKYTIYSTNHYTINEWEMQENIPVMMSKFKLNVNIPYSYGVVYSGRRLSSKYGNKKTKNGYSLTNLPALKEEPYGPNPDHFAEKIVVQYAGGGNMQYNVSKEEKDKKQNWEKFVSEYYDNQNLRNFLNKKNIKGLLSTIIEPNMSEKEKIISIYHYVRQNYKWNNLYRIYPKQKFSRLLKTTIGNSAEINFLLYKLLKTANINTYPILSCTKRYGMISKIFPLFSQFNHIMVHCNIDNKRYNLSAIDKLRPYNLPATNECVKNGLILIKDSKVFNKYSFEWIDIKAPSTTRITVLTNIIIDNKTFKKSKKISTTGYLAKYYRQDFKEDSISFYDSFIGYNNYDTDNSSIVNLENIDKPLVVESKISKEGKYASTRYLNVFKGLIKNPFNSTERELPVDMRYCSKQNYICTVELPKNYKVIAMPDNYSIATPNKKSIFIFKIKHINNKISINCMFYRRDKDYSRGEYIYLKAFYDQVVKILDKPIVVKEINI